MPNYRTLLVLTALSAWADVIVLKDGDRITGKIVKKDGADVTVDTKNFGTVKLKWENVATVEGQESVNVVLPGDRMVKGVLKAQDGKVEVVGTGESVAATEVVALRNDAEQKAYERMLKPRILDLWAITGGINLAGTRGNAETSTFTTPINFVRASRTSRTTAYFNSIRARATVDNRSELTAQAVRGGWAYSRNLRKRVFANFFNDNEYDRFQSLDLRTVLGAGLGYDLWQGERGRLSLVGGAAWNREKFSPADRASFSRNSTEAYWGDDFAYKLNSRTNITQAFRMFNNLSNGGEYRVNFDIGATTALTKWLSWNVALSDRYLSNPVAGRKNNDFLYTTGIGFTFAR
jgi:putative salt-induced outer membrane protein YdiY